MRALLYRILSLLPALAVAGPVLAGDGTTQVPEGSALTLFALGVIGVLIGRRGGRRARDRKHEDEQNNGED